MIAADTKGYQLDRATVAGRVRHILGLPMIAMEEAHQIAQALDWYEKGMDFGDALHLAGSHHMKGFATMDGRLTRKASQVAPGSHTILVR